MTLKNLRTSGRNILDELSDKQLDDTVERAVTAKMFLEGRTGQLVKEMCDDIAQSAETKLFILDLGNTKMATQLVEIIHFFKIGLFSELRNYMNDGRFAFDELQDRHGELTPHQSNDGES